MASGSVRTLCRVRPRNDKEAGAEEKTANIDAAGSRVSLPNKLGVRTDYEFNHAFGPDTADSLVLDKAWQSIEKALGGIDTTVIFYGQTGSGKSYLMGKLIERMWEVLYGERDAPSCFLSGTWVEVYNGQVRDLQAGSHAALDIGLERHGDGWKPKANLVGLRDKGDFQRLHRDAERRRVTSKTKVNATSSRSHSIFTLLISGLRSGEDETRLQLVDLAGSEEVDMDYRGLGDREKTEKMRQNNEAKDIKISLNNVGRLVRHAEEAKRGTPRPDSSRTVLQDPLTKIIGATVLSPGAETLVIFTLSPLEAHREKSLHTLLLAKELLGVHLKKSVEEIGAK